MVLEKYPHAGKFLKGLENWDLRSRGENRGADEEGQEKEENNGNGEEGEEMEEVGEINENDGRNGDEADEEDGNGEEEEEEDEEKTEGVKKEVRVKFGVDAMKLTRAKILGRTKTKKKRKKDQDKDEKQGGSERGFDKIVFNFPHVGGKTKDVNRQVRYNQGNDIPVFPPLSRSFFPASSFFPPCLPLPPPPFLSPFLPPKKTSPRPLQNPPNSSPSSFLIFQIGNKPAIFLICNILFL